MPDQATVIRGARIFDGERVQPWTWALLRNGRVLDVGTDDREPDTARAPTVVDGAGATLLPGLIDAHSHVLPDMLGQSLMFGVTTELDMFRMYSEPSTPAELKAMVADRDDVADVRSAGIGATAPGGHPTQVAAHGLMPEFPTISCPEDAEEFVARRVAEGSDYLKILLEDGTLVGQKISTLSPGTSRALVEAAHRRDRLVVAHANVRANAEDALTAGVDGLMHAILDEVPGPEFVERAVEKGTFVVPTLTAFEGARGNEDRAALAADPRLEPYLYERGRERLITAFPDSPPADAPAPPHYPNRLETIRILYQAGVSLLAGTDAGNPGTSHGISIHHELALLVDAGLPPAAALAAATSAPAQCFGLHDRGRIAPGLRADLLLIDGDPTTDITATRSIRHVWRRGTRLDRHPSTAS